MTATTPFLAKAEKLGPLASRYVEVESLPWKPTPCPGIDMKVLLEDSETGLLTALFRWRPGSELALHEHVEIEQTFVLEGSLEDEEGEVTAGNYVWRPKGNRHSARSPNGALAKQGAKGLICVSNGTRGGATLPEDAPTMEWLISNEQVKKVVCAFTAPTRASQRLVFTEYYESGRIEAELVPQGTLAERMRAAGAGIPAFYTPAAVGTELAEGRETRVFNGREYLLEEALPLDYAFIRAYQADAAGNLRFRRSQRNFNPIMAMAARVTVVEVEEDILPVGAIDPDDVHTAGIFVHRIVKIPPPPEGWWPQPPGSIGR